MRNFFACSVIVAVLTLSSGCGTRSVEPAPPNPMRAVAASGLDGVRDWGDGPSPVIEASIIAAFHQRRAAGRPLTEVNVLAISGGGAEGAFGAGVLCGWSAAGDDSAAIPRPTFDAVTGISTGALIAPFAFLGSRYDDQLRAFYTTVSTSDVLRRKPIWAALMGDSAADTEPLRRLLDSAITAEMLREIADEHRKGRRLFVGTTDLDAQRPVVWDMGAIAASGADGAASLFRKVMLASASIPGAFAPQYVDVTLGNRHYQEMHVDGGTMTQVFHFGQVLDYGRLRGELGLEANLPRRVWILRNGVMKPQWQAVQPRFGAIAGRAISTLLKANAAGDIYRIYSMSRLEGMEFNLAYIPDDYVSQAAEPFDKKEMNRLFDIGFELGRSGKAWTKRPPGVVAEPTASQPARGDRL